ncbi:MAG: RHS repeat-associated core domain-containing protein [Flavobacterium sp.]|nr:RHS repeat-associated core domain-containing protein [Flavobacterium sp.]
MGNPPFGGRGATTIPPLGGVGGLAQTEIHLYGSSRLGINNVNIDVTTTASTSTTTIFRRGNKFFELSNHLGNVLVTVSDKKLQYSSNTTSIDYYKADVVTANDYAPFGMALVGRKFTQVNSGYRYGFNGQEKSTEIGENSYTAEFWEYDSRIGRRWNIDPIVKDDESSYSTSGGNPIVMVDPDGSDWYKDTKGSDKGQVRWYEGSGKRKGMSHIGATYDGYTRENSGNRWMNGNDKGEKTIWLDPVTVTAKKKTDNSLMARAYPHFKEITPANVKMWNEAQWLYEERKNAGAQLIQGGENDYYLNNQAKFERTLQAYKDWKATQMAVFVEFPSLFIPVPRIGMFRWFGSATGPVFWSVGGTAGKAFASATEHALLNGGTTLEMTTAGKTLAWHTEKTSYRMTGRIWNFASKQFAKGAAGDIHMFMDLSKVRGCNMV